METPIALPRPHRLAAWLCLAVIGFVGTVAVAFGFALGENFSAAAVAIGILAIITTGIVNRRHNHDHLVLLVLGAILTILVAGWWSVVWFRPI